VLIVDGDDRALLGRHPSWGPGRFATFAGFVEPGESLEQAVHRAAGEVVMPGSASISSRLIEGWYGTAMPAGPTW
jgi:NAD+ diphosphatase